MDVDKYEKKADEEYKKFPNIDRAKVLELKQWVEDVPHLPNITEYEVIPFYHSCYFDMDKAKVCIEKYYTMRTAMPDFFSHRDVFDASIQNAMEVSITFPLPGLTPEGYRILYTQLNITDINKFDFVNQLKLSSVCFDFLLEDYGTCEGYVIINDLTGFAFRHMTKFRPIHMRNFMKYLQEAFPIRLKAIHYVNTVWFMHQALAMMRPFMAQEMLQMINLHKNVDSLVKKIPVDILPEEYGGKAGKIPDLTRNFFDKIMANANYFLKEEKTRRVTEGLRKKK